MIPNYKDRLPWPVPTQSLEGAPRLILDENSLQVNGKNYLQTHGTAMGTKVSVAFANIFKAKVEQRLNNRSQLEKVYMDDIFSLWDTGREKILPVQANNHYATIKFTVEIFENLMSGYNWVQRGKI